MKSISSTHPESTIKLLQNLAIDVPSTQQGCLWIHACSMGEINSIAPLVQRLLGSGYAVHLSVVTRTGFHQAQRLFANSISLSYLPWDFPGAMRRLLRHLNPSLLLLTETEFWPGMLAACKRNNVPVIGINTRISDRSFPRYMATRRLWQRWLAPVDLFLAQSDQDASRLSDLGISESRIRIVGNLKFAIQPPNVDTKELRNTLDSTGKRPILLVASTHEGEEKRLLTLIPGWHTLVPELLIIIVPRHPARFDAVSSLIEDAGLSMSRWSNSKTETSDVIVIDAMGLLSSMYTIADIVIIGGTIAPVGGHNPLEAAICGRGVVTGPHVENFRDIMVQMQSAGAAAIARNDTEIDRIVRRLLTNSGELKKMHDQALKFMHDKGNVLDRVFSALQPYLILSERTV